MCEPAKPCQPCQPCEGCRTINLALHNKGPKPSMQVQEKCSTVHPCVPDWSTPLQPTCIRVVNTDEYKYTHLGYQLPKPKVPHVGHGWLMYGLKAALVAGAVYFTYRQGVWGEQKDTVETANRWTEYFRSFSTRIPPKYDPCGRVIPTGGSGNGFLTFYNYYKAFITNMFLGAVKLPLVLKCEYVEYLTLLEAQRIKNEQERKIKKNTILRTALEKKAPKDKDEESD